VIVPAVLNVNRCPLATCTLTPTRLIANVRILEWASSHRCALGFYESIGYFIATFTMTYTPLIKRIAVLERQPLRKDFVKHGED
jgi:hypothetical protein